MIAHAQLWDAAVYEASKNSYVTHMREVTSLIPKKKKKKKRAWCIYEADEGQWNGKVLAFFRKVDQYQISHNIKRLTQLSQMNTGFREVRGVKGWDREVEGGCGAKKNNNSPPSVNFHAYCLNIQPQLHLEWSFCPDTYPIAVELPTGNFLPFVIVW